MKSLLTTYNVVHPPSASYDLHQKNAKWLIRGQLKLNLNHYNSKPYPSKLWGKASRLKDAVFFSSVKQFNILKDCKEGVNETVYLTN